jgi:hypothetical protein
MAAKILTQNFTGAANLAALKIAIDAWLVAGYVVVDVHVKDDGTEAMVFYYT